MQIQHRTMLTLGAAILSSALAIGQSAPVSDDAYIRTGASSNAGSEQFMWVATDLSSYVKFDLSVIPRGAKIDKATLRLYAETVVNTGALDVYLVNGTWSESTITGANVPARGAQVNTHGTIPVSKNSFVLIDVTSAVQKWVSGAVPNDGLVLVRGNNVAHMQFETKESTGTSHQPELELAIGEPGVAGPAGSQGPIGKTGPQGKTGPAGPIGKAGAAGPRGLAGATGPEGPAGPQGPAGTGGSGPSAAEIQAALVQWYPSTYSTTSPATGNTAYGIAFDGTYIWVTDPAINSVVKLFRSTGKVVGTYATGAYPIAAAFDGTNVWIANRDGASVTELVAATGQLVDTYPVGKYPLAVIFDGTNIWVANHNDSTVSKIVAATGDIVGAYTVGTDPISMALDGAGTVWVACEAGGVSQISAATGALVGTVTVTAPEAIAFDGRNMWVSTGAGVLAKIPSDSDVVANSYVLGDIATSLTFDGANIWLINFGGNAALKIQPSTGAILESYPTGHYPVGSTFDGTSLWVTSNADGTVTQIRATK